VKESIRFLWGFLRHPRAVGSVVPSSPFLARAVVSRVPHGARVVAEFGPGTGPLTRPLLARLGPEAMVMALEIDPGFCDILRRTLPDTRLRVIEAPAQELPRLAGEAGHAGRVEAVVSGLPFANFPPALRADIVRAAYDALAPGGVFAGYGYAPFALPPLLREIFGNCERGYVWRNIPPAFVFSARKE
jgi:phospholipid N-methyltransferase